MRHIHSMTQSLTERNHKSINTITLNIDFIQCCEDDEGYAAIKAWSLTIDAYSCW